MTSAHARLPIDERLAEIDAAEPARHAAEVRYVAAMPDHVARSRFLQGVEKKRGKPAADKLRADTWALMQGVRAP